MLKGEWGFKGILMSDWDATYDGVAAANNGLDLEMPQPRFMNAQGPLPAVQSGEVKESTIDDKVLRMLRTELRYGFTERPQFDPADSTYSVADRAVALAGRAREHHAAQERRPSAAARSGKDQDHCGHRPRCVAGGAGRRRFVGSHGL